MFEVIREIFDKKSPLLIITISILIATIIAIKEPAYACPVSKEVRLFQTMIIIVSTAEIILKTLGMEIFKRLCSSNIEKVHFFLIMLFVVLNIGAYVWSILLYLKARGEDACAQNEPHAYLVMVYASLYSLIYLGLLGMLVALSLQNTIMTVFQDQEKIGQNKL